MARRQRRSPKYERALNELRIQIESGVYPWQEHLPPERQLAEDLDINRQTLRKILQALNDCDMLLHEPGQGHRVIHKRLQAQMTSRAKIAVVFYRSGNLIQIDDYYGPIFSGIAHLAESKHDLLTQLLSAHRPLEEIDDLIKSENIQGIVALGVMDMQLLSNLQSLRIPVVSVDYDAHAFGIDSVVENDVAGARQACHLLTQLGHQHIAYLGIKRGSERVGYQEEASSTLRQQGYMQALQDANIADMHTYIATYDSSSSADAFNNLYAAHPEITAVFCFNDDVAVNAMRAAREHGLNVPEDLSIIGFGDDRQINKLIDTPLTTVRNAPAQETATAAVDLLWKRIKNPARKVQKVTLACELILRQTCAKAPA